MSTVNPNRSAASIELHRKRREAAPRQGTKICSYKTGCGRELRFDLDAGGGDFYVRRRKGKGGDTLEYLSHICRECTRERVKNRKEDPEHRRAIGRRYRRNGGERVRKMERENARMRRAMQGKKPQGPRERAVKYVVNNRVYVRHEKDGYGRHGFEDAGNVPIGPFADWLNSEQPRVPEEYVSRVNRWKAPENDNTRISIDTVDRFLVMIDRIEVLDTIYPWEAS